MRERPAGLRPTLAEIRRRLTRRSRLRAWTWGATAAATVLAVGLGASLLIARNGVPLVFTAAVAMMAGGLALARAMWSVRRAPTDQQLARFIEERDSTLDDVVVSAV